MKISGFTLVRNGVKFDYPFIESLTGLKDLCDEVVINIGISEDDTKEVIHRWIKSLPAKDQSKFILFESEWPLNDPEKRKGGKILAEQTNLALERCTGDVCVYLQADEVFHEEDLSVIKTDLGKMLASETDALVFQYVHFYGTFDVIQVSRSAYRREVRAIRNGKKIESVGDAQSFRYQNGEKIPALLSQARVFHYGWVRPPEVMKEKTGFMDTLYHPGSEAAVPATGDNYKYNKFIGLKPFTSSHPQSMHPRIEKRLRDGGRFDFKKAQWVFEWKDLWKIISGVIEKLTGIRLFEYRNYRLKGKL